MLTGSDTYYYTNKDKVLVIIFIYEDVSVYMDTENAVKKEFEIESNKVITWEKEKKNYFISSKKGLACQIYGNITKDEFIEIYNKISINEK